MKNGDLMENSTAVLSVPPVPGHDGSTRIKVLAALPSSTIVQTRGVYGRFPKLGVPFWGVPIIRIIVYWGSILGSPCLGTLPYGYPYKLRLDARGLASKSLETRGARPFGLKVCPKP